MSLVETSIPWPFRPRPEADEGLLGYLLRIAREYRWNSVGGLCGDLLGRSGPILPRSERLIRDVSRVLATVMQLDEQRLMEQWQRLRQRHHCFDSSRIITDVEVPHPRMCPECVVDSPYLRFQWQVGHLLHCEHHGCRLLEVCPACDSPLRWQADLLDGCPACGYAWTAVSSDSDFRDDNPPRLGGEHLDTLYRAFLAAALPGAPETWPRQTLPYVPGRHAAIMARAHAVVSERDGNSGLCAEGCAKLGALGVLAVSARRQLGERIASLYIPRRGGRTSTGRSAGATDETVALPQKVRRCCPPGQTAALIVSANTCAGLLGVTAATLHELIDNGVLPEAGRARVLRERLIPVGAVAEQLDEMVAAHASAAVENPVAFDEATQIVAAFGEKPWRILEWCQAGTLAFTPSPAGAFTDGLQVARRRLIDLAHKALIVGETEVFSRAEVLALLSIPESALDALSGRGHLPCKRWSAPGAWFEREPVVGFLRRHRIARREALIEGRSVREAWRRILEDGARPLVERVGRGHFIGVARVEPEDPSQNAGAANNTASALGAR